MLFCLSFVFGLVPRDTALWVPVLVGAAEELVVR